MYETHKQKYEASGVGMTRTTIIMPKVIETASELPSISRPINSYLSKKQLGFSLQNEEMSKLFPTSSYKITQKPLVFDQTLDLNNLFKYVT
jgi:hypothetical protein